MNTKIIATGFKVWPPAQWKVVEYSGVVIPAVPEQSANWNPEPSEQECRRCKRVKDTGQKCWWCGEV